MSARVAPPLYAIYMFRPASQYTAAGEQKEEVSSAYAKQPSTSTVASMATVRVRDRFILPTVKLANE